jgi:uncharacterized protein (TIGR03118 family)
MYSLFKSCSKVVLVVAGILALTLPAVPGTPHGYVQHNLVSDVSGMSPRTDSKLVNPWGLTSAPMGPLWVADQGSGVSTVYEGNGKPFPKPHSPLVVSIPSPGGGAGTPTGIVFNGTTDFVISQGEQTGPAAFIFATLEGALAAWNPEVNQTAAVIAADKSSTGAEYTGLAMASNLGANLLFAADFHNGVVAVFDSSFNMINSFTDSSIPAGFAPFGIRNIGGMLYVTYAKQEPPDNRVAQPGPGNGFVDVFTPTGSVTRFATQGTLNAPWGLVMTSAFGQFSNDILVGNFGDGRINAYSTSGTFLGQLEDHHGNPISINGLWALDFGNGFQGGSSKLLFFTAGIEGEMHGLLGTLKPVGGPRSEE